MQSFCVGVIARSLFPIFEPTGDFRCQSSSVQISEERGARAPLSEPKALRQLLALFLQFLRHHAA
jgi:hypothetical protein